MPLTVGVNTWITIAEADAYLTYNPYASAWFTLADTGAPGTPSKEGYLGASYSWIRSITKFRVPEDSTDPKVMQAQALLSLDMVRNGSPASAASEKFRRGLYSYKLSSKMETYNNVAATDGSATLPADVAALLQEYLSPGGYFIPLGRR